MRSVLDLPTQRSVVKSVRSLPSAVPSTRADQTPTSGARKFLFAAKGFSIPSQGFHGHGFGYHDEVPQLCPYGQSAGTDQQEALDCDVPICAL